MPALQKKHKKSSVHNIKSVMNTRYVFAPSVRYKIPVYNGRFRKNKSNQYRWFVAEKAKFTRPD